MSRRRRASAVALATLVSALAAGCAQLPEDDLTRGVRELAAGQGVPAVDWRRNAEADRAAALRRERLLADGLGPDEAAQVALLSAPDLQARFEELGVARGAYLAAASAPNPFVEWKRLGIEGGGSTVEWGLTANLLDLLTLPARRRAADAELEGARLAAADAVLRTAVDARRQHLRVLAAQRIVALRRDHADLGRLAFELAGRFRDAGNITAIELEEQRTHHLEARRAFEAAELSALDERLALLRRLGVVGVEDDLTITGALPPLPAGDPDTASLEARALERRLDLRAARAEADARLRRLSLTRSTRLVTGLEVGVSRETTTGEPRAQGPSLGLELPLFSQQQAALAEGDAAARLAMRRAEGLAQDARVEVRSAEAAMREARRRAATWQDEVLPARRAIVDGQAREFFYMLRGPFDPMRARQAALEAEIEAVEALRDYWSARAALALATGDLALATEEAAP